jgi:TRAP-type uncharacterized transport system fused permease subunit
MKAYHGDIIAILLYLAIIIGCFYGWISNIMIIAGSNFSDITGLLVLRVVGIFVAPLGVVLGYV